jgi:hypothetical protein
MVGRFAEMTMDLYSLRVLLNSRTFYMSPKMGKPFMKNA